MTRVESNQAATDGCVGCGLEDDRHDVHVARHDVVVQRDSLGQILGIQHHVTAKVAATDRHQGGEAVTTGDHDPLAVL